MRKTLLSLMLVAVGAGGVVLAQLPKQKTLDIYSIDVEGGKATLFVAPSGETMLTDAGIPGPRDSGRIIAAVKSLGIKQIDYMLVTHFDADHVGGVAEVAAEVPMRNFVDHGSIVVTQERAVAVFNNYVAARDKGHHILAKPGDKVPIAGLDVEIVTAGGEAVKKPLAGGGAVNPLCRDFTPGEDDKSEDPNSVGVVIRYGRFRALDLGDLTWNKEHDLVCPNNPLGTVDLYLTTRHGLNGAGAPVIVHAVRPRVAVMNNGPRKGASREAFLTIKSSPGLEDLWQVHYSVARPASPAANIHETSPSGGPELNTSEQMIANLDEAAAHTDVFTIKVSAREDGSFVVTNTRNGFSKEYKARR
jgi:beta-lactamase superfamily II metal-dependent hydrolase